VIRRFSISISISISISMSSHPCISMDKQFHEVSHRFTNLAQKKGIETSKS
jgi:hypothetical protein